MRLKNLPLAKEYAKPVEECFSSVHVPLENALLQVEYFYPRVQISQEKFYTHQEMVDREPIYVSDELDV